MYALPGKPEYGRGVRTGRYTFVVNKLPGKDEEVLLFDNAGDRYQMSNVAGERGEVVKDLRERLERKLKGLGDGWVDV